MGMVAYCAGLLGFSGYLDGGPGYFSFGMYSCPHAIMPGGGTIDQIALTTSSVTVVVTHF